MRLTALLSCTALAIFAVACEASLDDSLANLKVGDCVSNPAVINQEIESLDEVECDDPDALEVIEVIELEGSQWPGQETIDQEAVASCPETTTLTLYPTQDSWEDADDRSIVCFE